MMSAPGVAEPTPNVSTIKIEGENVEHARMLREYCETGKLPEGYTVDVTPLIGREESRNVHLIDGDNIVVLNGGRYRVREGIDWVNHPVNPNMLHAPEALNLLGEMKKGGGVSIVTPEGDVISYPGDEPQGAFWPESLKGKIACTQKAAEVAEAHQIDVVLPRFTAAHEFVVEGKTVAAGVYQVKNFIPYREALQSVEDPFAIRYGQYFTIGEFVRAGYIHPQYHGGNRGVIFDPIKGPVAVFLDWEDAYSIKNHRTDIQTDLGFTSEIHQLLMTPKEKAEVLMLIQAIKADLHEILTVEGKTQKELIDIINVQYLSPILLGYLGIHPDDGVDLTALQQNFIRASAKFFPNDAANFWSIATDYAEKTVEAERLHLGAGASLETALNALTTKQSALAAHQMLSYCMAVGLVIMKREKLPMLADRK